MENSTIQFDSLFNLMDYFNTEEQCLKYIIQKRWGGTPECKKCQSTSKVYYIKSKKAFKCSRKTCIKGGHISVKKGTIFQNSNVPLKKWFMAMFFFSTEKKGISSVQLAKHIKVQQRTAWLMLQKLRNAAGASFENMILEGIVEVDETLLGSSISRDKRLAVKKDKKKKIRLDMDAEGIHEKIKRQRNTGKYQISRLEEIFDKLPPSVQNILWDRENRIMLYQPLHNRKNVVGFKERNIKNKEGKIIKRGKLFATPLGRQSGDICTKNVFPLMKDYISKNAHIMTDQAPIYFKIDEYFSAHSTVNHSKKEYVNGEKTTNSIENVWCMFKKVEKGTYHQFSYKYSLLYCYEFAFRHNIIDVPLRDCFLSILDYSLDTVISKKEIVSMPAAYFYRPR